MLINSNQFVDILALLISKTYEDIIVGFDTLNYGEEKEIKFILRNLISIEIYEIYNTLVFINLDGLNHPYTKITIEKNQFDDVDKFYYEIKFKVDEWLNQLTST